MGRSEEGRCPLFKERSLAGGDTDKASGFIVPVKSAGNQVR